VPPDWWGEKLGAPIVWLTPRLSRAGFEPFRGGGRAPGGTAIRPLGSALFLSGYRLHGAAQNASDSSPAARAGLRFSARLRQGAQKPERGVPNRVYPGFVRMNLGMSNKLARHSFSDGWKALFRSNPANVILSTVWGFEPASPTGGRRKRKELASLYAAYVSFLNR
jgi:hypothetical protein